MTSPWLIAFYALIPMVVSIVGGLIASYYIPKPKLTSFLQHFVAGVVIAAVAIELLPKILGHGSRLTIGIGFVIGVIVVLVVHELSHFLAGKQKKEGVPLGLVVGAAIDLFIDGFLIGIAFIAGQASGIFIAVSLSLCAFFLNLTVTATLSQRGVDKWKQGASSLIMAIMLPWGALIGSSIVGHLPPAILTETLAFGVAALLYLGVEELLGEAHTSEETPWISSAFFLGFLLIVLFKI